MHKDSEQLPRDAAGDNVCVSDIGGHVCRPGVLEPGGTRPSDDEGWDSGLEEGRKCNH